MRLPWAVLVLAAVRSAAAQDLGDDLVIETERGALRGLPAAPKVDVIVDAAVPIGPTAVTVRVDGWALQDVTQCIVSVDGREVARLQAPPFQVTHDFGSEAARHEIVATVTRAKGETVTGSRVTMTPSPGMLTSRVDLVQVNVIVKDAEGRRVQDLEEKDFTVMENGVAQPLRHFSRERTPLHLVMTLDSSGSMEGRLWSLKKSAVDFLRKVDDDVPLQIVDFDHEVRLEQDFTLDRDKAASAVNRLKEGGGTHLWDAAYSSAFGLSGKDGRRAVVLFTDGVDQTGEDDERRIASGLDEVIDVARQERVQFYCIGFGNKIDSATLERLSDETGGVFYRADSTKEFRQVYDAILADVASQYTLAYDSTDDRKDGSYRAIEVRLARPGLVASYRKGYKAK